MNSRNAETDVMLDLETLGVNPGCIILSVGAVFFDPWTLRIGDSFYSVIRQDSCFAHGLTAEPETMRWWSEQSEQAKSVLELARQPQTFDLDQVCKGFNSYLELRAENINKLRVWGNGANFDQPILRAAYKACGVKPAWSPFGERCYRTLKAMRPAIKCEPAKHHAMMDARQQAEHMQQIMQSLRVRTL